MALTIEQIKNDLPEVNVRYNGEVKRALVCGRKLRFPIACILGESASFEFSWPAIARAVNTGAVLNAD